MFLSLMLHCMQYMRVKLDGIHYKFFSIEIILKALLSTQIIQKIKDIYHIFKVHI